MRLLLDTHVLLWWFNEPERLAEACRAAIADEGNVVLVSSVSIWEAGIKQSLGKLQGAQDLAARVGSQRMSELVVSWRHAELAAALPPHHSDPFDRMLIAQAVDEGVTLVTRDPRFRDYEVALLYA